MSEDIYKLKEDEQTEFGFDNSDKQHTSNSGSWVVGLVFIAAGMGLLLSRSIGFDFDNWWALFILIPAVSSLVHAWQGYQRKGRLDEGSRGALMGGLFMSMIASVFLFGLSWSLVWPLALIFVGIAALTSG